MLIKPKNDIIITCNYTFILLYHAVCFFWGALFFIWTQHIAVMIKISVFVRFCITNNHYICVVL